MTRDCGCQSGGLRATGLPTVLRWPAPTCYHCGRYGRVTEMVTRFHQNCERKPETEPLCAARIVPLRRAWFAGSNERAGTCVGLPYGAPSAASIALGEVQKDQRWKGFKDLGFASRYLPPENHHWRALASRSTHSAKSPPQPRTGDLGVDSRLRLSDPRNISADHGFSGRRNDR